MVNKDITLAGLVVIGFCLRLAFMSYITAGT